MAATLAKGLGYHPMALNVARGALARATASPADTATRILARVQQGSGLGGLPGLRPDEHEREVEAAFAVSYGYLAELPEGEQCQRQFRSLGVFAPASSFDTAAAGAVLGMETVDAESLLEELCALNLLDAERGPIPRFSQHALLRSYCRALLTAAGELTDAEVRHIAWYAELATRALAAGTWFSLAPDTEQLAHAIERGVILHLARAVTLLQATGDLFLNQGRSAQHLALARAFRDRAVATVNPEIEALGHGLLGNAALRAAGALAGEARQGRLEEAVAAYREALRFHTAEAAPLAYAMTQNNLGATLGDLAGSLAGEARQAGLEEAVAAYRQALRFYTAEAAPMQHETVTDNLRLALGKLEE
ncbi:MAG: hypothetical protein ACRDJU_02065 [Actinomycetota bacterium]